MREPIHLSTNSGRNSLFYVAILLYISVLNSPSGNKVETFVGGGTAVI